jgi:hypothetical protein
MTDYRELFSEAAKSDKYVAAWMLKGADVDLEIESVSIEEVVGEKGKKDKLPVLAFKGRDKGMVLNKTNGKMVAKLHGKDFEDWVGKTVTVYPTECEAKGGEIVECIRIRYEFK